MNQHHPTPPLSKDLHPIWYRHFGIQSLQPSAATARQPQVRPVPRNSGDASSALLHAVQALVATQCPTKLIN